MKIVTASEMRQLDEKTINSIGVSSLVLMENAGRGVAETIRDFYPLKDFKGFVLVLAGRGNNGGDGFVIARWLKEMGYPVKVLLIGEGSTLKGDAKVNWQLLPLWGVDAKELTEKNFYELLSKELAHSSLVVDALLGTGLQGGAKGVMKEVISLVTGANKPVIAVDVPSGLDSTTGEVKGPCIKATITVTMGCPKLGMFLVPGMDYIGKLKVVPIGIPPSLLEEIPREMILPGKLTSIIPHTPVYAHKRLNGRLLLVAGSRGMSGAAMLSALGALPTGVGLLKIAIPNTSLPGIETVLKDAVKYPLPETDTGGGISSQAVEVLLQGGALEVEALAIGPGLGRHPDTIKFTLNLISRFTLPMVIDADALFALSTEIGVLKHISNSSVILTPHPGELGYLISKPAEEVIKDPLGSLNLLREKIPSSVIIILKGACSIVSVEEKIYISPFRNPALGKGGSGDVLTGIIGGLLARGISPLGAALLGITLHGICGELGAERKGMGLIASDLPEFLPKAIKCLTDYNVNTLPLIHWLL